MAAPATHGAAAHGPPRQGGHRILKANQDRERYPARDLRGQLENLRERVPESGSTAELRALAEDCMNRLGKLEEVGGVDRDLARAQVGHVGHRKGSAAAVGG